MHAVERTATQIAVNASGIAWQSATAGLRMEPARPCAEGRLLCGPRAGRLHYCDSGVNFLPLAHENGECLLEIFAES